MLNPQKAFVPPQEYLALEERAEYKSEYYHGEIFAMAGCTPKHNQITVNLIATLHTALQDTPCRVFTSDMRVQVEKRAHYVYPDLGVVCGELEFAEDRNDMIANPLVIVEVLSESIKDYDRGSKFTAYRKISTLRDYVLIDQNSVHVEYFHKHDTGQWMLEEFTNREEKFCIYSLHLEIALHAIYAGVEWQAMKIRGVKREGRDA